MWQRARGTFNYPEFNSGNGGALVGGGKEASGMTANNLKRHVSKTDRVASQRIQKMRELAKQDALIKASMDEEAEQQVNKENEKQKRYIAPAPWEDAPDQQPEIGLGITREELQKGLKYGHNPKRPHLQEDTQVITKP